MVSDQAEISHNLLKKRVVTFEPIKSLHPHPKHPLDPVSGKYHTVLPVVLQIVLHNAMFP